MTKKEKFEKVVEWEELTDDYSNFFFGMAVMMLLTVLIVLTFEHDLSIISLMGVVLLVVFIFLKLLNREVYWRKIK